MIWGLKNNQRIKAIPKGEAKCELCNTELIAKCGEIKIWHWAHKSNKECDNWWEPESEWHINWKNEFPPEQQEVKIGKHRADIKTRTGTIIELQANSISPKEIREREEFYENMIWLLNYKTIAKNFQVSRIKPFHNLKKWRWKPSIVKYSKKPIFIDATRGIWKIHKDSAILYSKEDFLKIYGDIYGK